MSVGACAGKSTRLMRLAAYIVRFYVDGRDLVLYIAGRRKAKRFGRWKHGR